MGVVRKSNAYMQIAEATRRETQGNRETRMLTLLAACLVLMIASWFVIDHASSTRPTPRAMLPQVEQPSDRNDYRV